MVARSSLVDVRPFRTGLAVVSVGFLLVLGEEHGGYLGQALETTIGRLLGETGVMILGAPAFWSASCSVTGASVGAILRRSGTAMRNAGTAARRRLERPVPTITKCQRCHLATGRGRHRPRWSTARTRSRTSSASPSDLSLGRSSDPEPEPETLFEVEPADQDYRLPTGRSCALACQEGRRARPASAWPSCSCRRSATSASRRT